MLLRTSEQPTPRRKAALSNRLKRIDWDFAGYACASAFAAVHWHPCRFVAQIPASLIGLLSKPGDTVLDPFCGAGTTLVEAQRLGRQPIGIDINPISTLISRSKLGIVSAEAVSKAIARYKRIIVNASSDKEFARSIETYEVPESVQLEKWYHRDTARQLAFLWTLISRSTSSHRDLLRAAFSGILIAVCNETRHWGYVCDNTQPKSVRRTDAIGAYFQALDRYLEAYEERDKLLGEGVKLPLAMANVQTGDAATVISGLKAGSIDLIVTSPPYFGVCDYAKAQRLSMEWFNHEIESIRSREIGARSKRHRQTAATDYVVEVSKVLHECARVLRKGKHLALILGESGARSTTVDDVVAAMEQSGFNVIADEVRSVSIQRRQNPSILEERVIVGQKTW